MRTSGQATFRPADHPAGRDRWDPASVVSALREWDRETGAVPRRRDWSGERPEHAGDAQRKWMREHPRWPSSTCVARHAGSWTAALEAAGLRLRRLPERTDVRARVERARDLCSRGRSTSEIATLLDVSAASVRRYLAADECPGCAGPVVDPVATRCLRCAAREPSVRSRWDEASCRAALHAWVRRHGAPPTFAQWTPSRQEATRWREEWPRWPSATVVTHLWRRHATPWTAALDGRRP